MYTLIIAALNMSLLFIYYYSVRAIKIRRRRHAPNSIKHNSLNIYLYEAIGCVAGGVKLDPDGFDWNETGEQ